MIRPSRRQRLAVTAAILATVAVVVIRDRLVSPEGTDVFVPQEGTRWSRLPGDGKPVREPNQRFFTERAWPQMSIPLDVWRAAQLQARALADDFAAAHERDVTTGWAPRGPTNVGGRITDLAVDPRDQAVVYAGAAEGGLMRTHDAGQHWDLVFDDQPSLAVGAVALDPVNPDIVYVGTGEVNPGGGSVAYGGTGIYRSLDQGDTWTGLGLENCGSIGRIVIDPANPDRIYAAAMGNLWAPGPDRGVYRSTDGGATWDLALYLGDTIGCVDLVIRPDNPWIILAAMWQRIRTPERYDYGGPGCSIWRTDDGGNTWGQVTGSLPTPQVNSGRIGLALCQAQPNRMYAVYADRTGYFAGLFRSDNGGANWAPTNDDALASVFASYGWWFGNVRCHPDNPDVVFVLGLEFYRSTNGGASWSLASSGVHVDHHAMAWGPAPARVLYEGSDGGVYRSTNGGTVWTMLPDQPITQVYRLGLDAQNPDAIYLGGQDISTVRTLTGALDDWTTILGGDGFQPLVHPLLSSRIWAQYQYGAVYYSSNGGSTFSWAGNGIGSADRIAWNAPHAQDPTIADRRYFGTNKLYRNSGPTGWAPISGDLTGGPHQGQGGQVDGTLTTIGVSAQDPDVIWTGSDDGRVHVTTSGGLAWTDVSAGLPERWITSVRADPFDRETAYVTVSGFRWDEPLPHVLMTDDLGLTWSPIAGNLPEAPVNDLLACPERPGLLFVATDLGVYQTTQGGSVWSLVADGLPNVVVTHLAWNAARDELLAGTYGRSVYAVAVVDPTPAPDQVDLAALGRLRPAFPNPASGGTMFAWDLARGGEVTVEVFTVSGRRVWQAGAGGRAAGPGSLFWDGRDGGGRPAAAGVYLARVLVDGRVLGRETVVLAR
ncbi:MAG TPA: glycosyl hydrolase [Candidatus Krumholzibacteria bacterium]|nr:glycosyl hydrolase [Candidatus Krumholzibacteria bacterium]HPD72516.1 glycosyl hydrolase [Candidatus Krumholzibacteria bacterium]HRY40552.1 glycosyl hydrolase [Candidatus Krumholzibacteria bacterium]